MTNEPVGLTAAQQRALATRSSRGSVIAAIASGLGLAALAAVAVVLNLTLQRATVPEAAPDMSGEFFQAVRLTDADAAMLGLEASEGGLQASTLATAVGKVQYEWRNAKGAPAECMFAGWYPGTSTYPVTGLEVDADPLWKEKVVSATQTLAYDGTPYVNITTRLFDDADAATQYLEDWDALIAGCTEFTSQYRQLVTTTSVEPLHYDELLAANSGWLASTPQLNIAPTAAEPEFIAAEFFVLDVQQKNAVVRVTMFSPTDPSNDAAFLELVDVVSDNLDRAIS